MSAQGSMRGMLDLAARAGALIMRHYAARSPGREKADRSPVTDADEEAERFILDGLRDLFPGVPVVSEEAAAAGIWPVTGDRFLLVDPLDGTKEFLARNGEFTVNIALIEHGAATMGVVYAPAFGRLFAGGPDGATEYDWPASEAEDGAPPASAARPIRARVQGEHPLALWSRTHDLHRAEEYRRHYDVAAVRTMGSSIKFCLIAAGESDLYPRHGPTMEWDTAAGQAVLEAAGGSLRDLHGAPLRYGKVRDGFRNPSFVARGRVARG